MEGKLAHGKKLNVIRCREMQVKNRKYIIAYLPEWLILKKIMSLANAGKNIEKLGYSYIVGWNVK